jgi:serine/threonine-protein kinase
MGLEGQLVDGKYRIRRLIGEGGMGRVYEAEHVRIDRVVALKVLHVDLAVNDEVLARFEREARAAGRIGHDNICEVTDAGRLEEGVPYFVMPLLRGKPLSDTMTAVGPLPVERGVDIILQILSALEAAHAAGIVHRDLKPSNVFLTRLGDREDFVKVLDFGISKVIGVGATQAKITHTGTVLGTPHYMSPEQARGLRDIDQRVDVYAAGVILYEMLTTKTPFNGESHNAILSAILLDAFTPPRMLRPDVSPELEAVILRAMERDRDRRFRDAAAMRAALVEATRIGRASATPILDPAAATLTAPSGFGKNGASGGAVAGTAPDLPTTPRALGDRTVGGTDFGTVSRRRSRAWIGLLAAGLAMVATGVALWRPWRSPSSPPASLSVPAAGTADAAPAEPAVPQPGVAVPAAAPGPAAPGSAEVSPATPLSRREGEVGAVPGRDAPSPRSAAA